MRKKLIKRCCVGVGIFALLLVAAIAVKTKKDANASALVTNSSKEDSGKIQMKKCDVKLKADWGLDKVIYTGKEVTQEITVSYRGEILNKDTDYTLVYYNNIKKGRAYAKITGMGKYTGSVEEYFSIKSLWMGDDCKVNVVDNKIVVYFRNQIIDLSEYEVVKFVQKTNSKGQVETKFEVHGLGVKVDGNYYGKIVEQK